MNEEEVDVDGSRRGSKRPPSSPPSDEEDVVEVEVDESSEGADCPLGAFEVLEEELLVSSSESYLSWPEEELLDVLVEVVSGTMLPEEVVDVEV